MSDWCPHCGSWLPPDYEACCGDCRGRLGKRTDPAGDHGRAVVPAILMSVLTYAVIVGTTMFAPEVRAKATEVFGPAPLGLPAVVVACLLETLLYLPVPRGFYHHALIGEQARRDGRRWLGLGDLGYVVQVGRRHRRLARSRRIYLGTLTYSIAVVAAWIGYASAMGI